MKQILIFLNGEEKEFFKICPACIIDPREDERFKFFSFVGGRLEQEIRGKVNPSFSVKFEGDEKFLAEGLDEEELAKKVLEMAFNPDTHTADCKSS